MGSAEVQGELWGRRPVDWSELQESAFRPLYDGALDATKVGPGTAFLDVGCGAGLACRMAQARDAVVAGLDASAALIEIARKRCPGADLRVGEIEALPFADRSFDVTTGFNAFQYAADPVRALIEAKRVTRPRGAVVVAEWGNAERCDFTSLFRALGSLLPSSTDAPGPFAISASGALESFVAEAGLKPEHASTVDIVMRYPDEDTALRGVLSSGAAAHFIRHAGEPLVRQTVAHASRKSRKSDGSYVFTNEFRVLVARA